MKHFVVHKNLIEKKVQDVPCLDVYLRQEFELENNFMKNLVR